MRPLETAMPEPGMRVFATLSDEGAVGLANQVGPRVRAVDGIFIGQRADSLELGVVQVVQNDGVVNLWNRESVRIPRAAVTDLHERRLDRGRSAILGGMIAGGAVLAAHLFSGIFGGDSGDGPGPAPPN